MFINKSQKEKIELLNSILGTRYRTKPYDLLNTKDLIEAATYLTAEYIDMDYYQGTIGEINADFDESLEVFHPASWANLTFEGTTNDDEIDEAIHYINCAENSMKILKDRAEKSCQWIWEIILTSDSQDVKTHFFGQNVTYALKDIQAVFAEDLIEIIEEIDYNGNIEHSALEFARGLLRELNRNKVES